MLVAGFFAYRPEIEKVVAEAGEKVYVSVYGWFVARDAMAPDPKRIIWQD